MVTDPERFDVLVAENIFDDTLSDFGAGLMGGLGCPPSAHIGNGGAVFRPCHGTVTEIASQRRANPLTMFLSAALMLDWLETERNNRKWISDGLSLQIAVAQVLAKDDVVTPDLDGPASTLDVAKAVADVLF